MNHLPFILAAYAVTLVGTVGVTWLSLHGMRRAEKRADAIRERT